MLARDASVSAGGKLSLLSALIARRIETLVADGTLTRTLDVLGGADGEELLSLADEGIGGAVGAVEALHEPEPIEPEPAAVGCWEARRRGVVGGRETYLLTIECPAASAVLRSGLPPHVRGFRACADSACVPPSRLPRGTEDSRFWQ